MSMAGSVTEKIGSFFAPVLRRACETEQGPHRSATPESTHMKNISSITDKAKPRDVVSSVELITPSAARHLRDTAHFERQRKISEANVERLAAEMREGRFTPGTQVYICALPNGSELIVNGNHTLEAVARGGVPQVLTITRKAVASNDEAGRIYAAFDIQKVRSWRDSLRATGIGDDIPNATYVLSALGVIDSKFGHGSQEASARSRLNRIGKMEDYRAPAAMWADATAGAPGHTVRLIRRAPVMAVALETFRYQPSLAAEFWGRAAHDDGLTTKMPEKALLNWLRGRTSGGGTAHRDHCRAAALAWNAAFRGDERQYIKPNKMIAFFLLGTPLAGGLGE